MPIEKTGKFRMSQSLTERYFMKPAESTILYDTIKFLITPKFKIGNLVATCSVADRMDKDAAFKEFVSYCYRRYISCDWGDSCKEDKKSNDDAVRNEKLIHAVYKFDESTTLWIITEWDRSVTTLLFPEDY